MEILTGTSFVFSKNPPVTQPFTSQHHRCKKLKSILPPPYFSNSPALAKLYFFLVVDAKTDKQIEIFFNLGVKKKALALSRM